MALTPEDERELDRLHKRLHDILRDLVSAKTWAESRGYGGQIRLRADVAQVEREIAVLTKILDSLRRG